MIGTGGMGGVSAAPCNKYARGITYTHPSFILQHKLCRECNCASLTWPCVVMPQGIAHATWPGLSECLFLLLRLLAEYKPGTSPPVYTCTDVPKYQVGHGHELPPSNSCLPGAEAWGICGKGSFFCQVASRSVSLPVCPSVCLSV